MAPDVDALTQRAVLLIERWSRRGVKVANGLLIVVVSIVAITTILGIIVTPDPLRAVFIIATLMFGTLGIGAAWLGRWRLGVALREIPSVTNEIHQLISTNANARAAISAYVVDEGDGEVIVASPAGLASQDPARARGERLIDAGQRLSSLRQLVGEGTSRFATLAAVAASAKSFPFLALVAGAITLGFAALGTVFAIALMIQILV